MSIFLDLVLLALLVMFVVLGAKKGFVKALLDGFSTLIAGVLAYTFVDPASQYAYDSFVRGILKNRLNNALSSSANDYNTVAEKVEELIIKIPDSAINFSEKIGFNVSGMLEALVEKNSDKEVLVEAIMTDILDKIMMPLVETVTLIILFVLFILAMKVVVWFLDGIVKKIPVIKETDKIFGGILGILKGVVVVLVVCLILAFMAKSSENTQFVEMVTSSKILEFVNNNNPLLNILN